jgi:hypothetical protein
MVQVIQKGPSLAALTGQYLGQSLGQGLGNFMGNYQANKALEGVLNNPELKNAPQSERLQALTTALSRHGEKGQKLLQNALMGEQQRMQEMTQKREGSLVQKLLSGQEISQQDLEGTRPELQIMAHKAMQPKAPLGGLSGQSVPPEISQKIPQILNENKNASAEELATKLDEAGIPRAYSNSYIETRRRQEETTGKQSAKEKLVFHQESQKYDEEIQHQADAAIKQISAIEDIGKAIESGNVQPTSVSNIFRGFGTIGDKIADALLNQDQATINASIPQLLEGWKQVFGVRLSDADLKVLQDKLPSLTKSPEANKAVLKIMKKYADVAILKNDIGKQIKKENNGIRPVNYSSLVSDRFNELIKPVKMKFQKPDGKEVIVNIPKYKTQEALLGGGKLVNE